MPETKPDLFIDDDGVCNACLNMEKRKEIDWDKRKQELLKILGRYKSKDGSNYDCIVPVSGGKDSTFQRSVPLVAASIFHFTQQTPLEAKKYLKKQGFNVRL